MLLFLPPILVCPIWLTKFLTLHKVIFFFALMLMFYLVADPYLSLAPRYASCFLEGQESSRYCGRDGWIQCFGVQSGGAESSMEVGMMGKK